MASVNLRALDTRTPRLLVVKLSSMGDIIHGTAAIGALRLALPQAHITLAVDAPWADVVRHHPSVDQMIHSSAPARLTPGTLLQIRRQLRGHVFDVAIDLQGNRRSAAWIYLSGAPIKVGRGGVRPGWQAAVSPDLSRHAVTVCGDICRAIGVPADDLLPEIHTHPDDERRLNAVLDREGLPREGFVLFNPFSGWASKSWSIEDAAAFVADVRSRRGEPVVLTGGSGEAARAQALVARLGAPAIPSLAGRLPLSQSLCLFRRARLMVSCDSGPMHAAAAFGVPVVALFGPTHPERTGPWGSHHVVLQARRPPQHHTYRTDTDATYMRALSWRVVSEAVVAQLAGATRDRGQHA